MNKNSLCKTKAPFDKLKVFNHSLKKLNCRAIQLMKHDLPALDSLKVFEAAARHLSFLAASQELCMSKGAVSYQISKLEEQLGQPLFERGIRQVHLTKSGQSLFKTTHSVFNQLRKQLQQMAIDQQQQPVTIAVSTYVAVRWLSNSLIGFTERHPHINILLQHSVNDENFNLQESDLALRWSNDAMCQSEECIASASIDMYPSCSPRLLIKHNIDPNQPLTIDQFTQAPLNQTLLLADEHKRDCWQQWFDLAGIELENPNRLINDSNVRVQNAVDGQGWMLADQLMKNELHNQLLVAPFNTVLKGYNYALLCHPKRELSNNAAILKQWLIEKLAEFS
jgi:LysR family glycine cleavage system transcriptional activator